VPTSTHFGNSCKPRFSPRPLVILSIQLSLEERKQGVADLLLYHRLYRNQFEKWSARSFRSLWSLPSTKQEPEYRINFKGSRVQHRPCVAMAREESWHGSKESQKEAASRTSTGWFVCMHAASALTCGNGWNAVHPPRASIGIPIIITAAIVAVYLESNQVRDLIAFQISGPGSRTAFTLPSSLLRKMYCIICTVITGTCESHRTREGRQADGGMRGVDYCEGCNARGVMRLVIDPRHRKENVCLADHLGLGAWAVPILLPVPSSA